MAQVTVLLWENPQSEVQETDILHGQNHGPMQVNRNFATVFTEARILPCEFNFLELHGIIPQG